MSEKLTGVVTKSTGSWYLDVYKRQLLTLSIVSNIIVNLGTFMNDRFIFMASVGFCIFLVHILTEKVQKLPFSFSKYVSFSLLGIFIIFYAFKTYSRVPDWENALTLNKSAIKVSKNSARANSFMATASVSYTHLDVYKRQL